MNGFWVNGVFGLWVVGTTFGIARYGYGLFLPQAQETFHIGPILQGTIGSGSYGTYVIATMIAAYMSHTRGPRLPVLIGLLFAFSGMALVSVAKTAELFAVGIIVAGASPGFIFPALSDWSIIKGSGNSDRLFSIMNSGTGAGVVLAVPLALAVSVDTWQIAWIMFTAITLALGIVSIFIVPTKKRVLPNNTIKTTHLDLRYMLIEGAAPLYFCAFIAGLTTAVYWTYSVSAIVSYDSIANHIQRPELLFWTVTGLSGLLGALAGDAVLKLGVITSFKLTILSICIALALITFKDGGLTSMLFSAFIFGASFIFITGILSVWTMRVFIERPSIGIGYTFLIFTFGAMFGPFLGGLLISHSGYLLMFSVFSTLAFLTALIPSPILYAHSK
ncbi:MFS transporter [Marinomonas sp.]|nr:MFS transporter [Marinomonas sp.]MDB4837317.1 MFS transporter [Marinomonas sp.]